MRSEYQHGKKMKYQFSSLVLKRILISWVYLRKILVSGFYRINDVKLAKGVAENLCSGVQRAGTTEIARKISFKKATDTIQ